MLQCVASTQDMWSIFWKKKWISREACNITWNVRMVW